MFDTVSAARALFGLSIGFHIIFAIIGVGLPLFLLIVELQASRTGDEIYRQMAVRWARIFALLFAIGAVTGTLISLELGLLFPGWIEFSGSIVGFIFTLEGVAFFIEAIFLGLYIYGRGRILQGRHWILTIPLLIASSASAFLIISVNAWMNQPTGFDISNGQAVNIDFLDVFFNKAMPQQVVHGILSAYVAVGFMIAGIYALAMLRGDRSSYNRKGLMLGMAIAAIAIPLQIISGDFSSQFVAANEPVKFAAMEAQFETEKGAPLRIGGIPDPVNKTTRLDIEIPKMASFMAFRDLNAEILGLNEFPEDEIPDVRAVHYAFQVMVGLGFAMLFVAAWFWFQAARQRGINPGKLLLLAVAAATPFGFLALEAGWMVTEFGRQPWIINQVMRTSEAATPRGGISALLVVFAIVFLVLAVSVALLFIRHRRLTREAALA